MDTIPTEIVDAAWDEVLSVDPEEAESTLQGIMEAQPAVCAYLLAVDEELLPPDEHGFVMMLGCCVLRTFNKVKATVPAVQEEELEEASQANFALLDSGDGEGVGEVSGENLIERFTKNYRQGPLLNAVLVGLMEGQGEEGGEEFAPENIALLFLHLKTVIDCLDR